MIFLYLYWCHSLFCHFELYSDNMELRNKIWFDFSWENTEYSGMSKSHHDKTHDINTNTPVTQRQPTRQRTTNATEINKQSCGVNTCLGTTCHGSVWSVASCFQTGIYILFRLLISTVFVVASRVGCLGVTTVYKLTTLSFVFTFNFFGMWTGLQYAHILIRILKSSFKSREHIKKRNMGHTSKFCLLRSTTYLLSWPTNIFSYTLSNSKPDDCYFITTLPQWSYVPPSSL